MPVKKNKVIDIVAKKSSKKNVAQPDPDVVNIVRGNSSGAADKISSEDSLKNYSKISVQEILSEEEKMLSEKFEERAAEFREEAAILGREKKIEEEAEKEEKAADNFFSASAAKFKRTKRIDEVPNPVVKEQYFPRREKRSVWFYLGVGALLFFLVFAAYAAIKILPRAEIKIVSKKSNWNYDNPVVFNSKIAQIDAANRQIPAAVFSQDKNMIFSAPATGQERSVERKAEGEIIVYNSSASIQPLVAGTRFESPDGKIFKLKNKIIIPAAKTENGNAVPSAISAQVAAAEAGDAYNLGPTSRFFLPGLAGTPKYEQIYGESKNPMTGGFIGTTKEPTEDDIAKAKDSAEKSIKENLDALLLIQIPKEMKIIDKSRQFSVASEIVNKNVDKDGHFSVAIEAKESILTFKESDLVKLMSELAQQVLGDGYEIKTYEAKYGEINSGANGTSTISLSFASVFWKPINGDDFKAQILGKSEADLKAIIFSSSNIEKADVGFWPFWVSGVPNDKERIKIEVN